MSRDFTNTKSESTVGLGEVRICRNVFFIPHDQSPFRDDTGLLQAIVYEPTAIAYLKAREVK